MEILDRLAEVANVDELKQSVHVALELRESILASCNSSNKETSHESSDNIVQKQQAQLAHQLQSSLTEFQVLTVVHAPVLASSTDDQMLQRVIEVASQLCDDLAAVVIMTEVDVQQADSANQTEHTTFKESHIIDKFTEQKEKSKVFEEAVTVQNDVALEDQAKDASESVVSLPVESLEIPIAEMESQLTENIKETTSEVFSQGTSIESMDIIAQLPDKSMVDEGMGISTIESGVVVSDETVVSIEHEALSECKSEFVVDEKLDKLADVTNTEKTSPKDAQFEVTGDLAANESVTRHQDEVMTTAIIDNEIELSAPFTGNFVLSYCITLIL